MALDLEIGTLTVRESVFEGKVQRPKTQRALRTIPLGPHAVQALKEHRAAIDAQGRRRFRVPNRKGDPLRESKLLTNVLQPAAETAGLGRVTWHQFRHIHSSLLNDLRAGEDRAGATRTREHADDAQHLHARRRRVASAGDRGGRRAIVPNCSQVSNGDRLRKRIARK